MQPRRKRTWEAALWLISTKMRQKISEQIEIPAGISCTFSDNFLKCKLGELEVSRKIDAPCLLVSIRDNQLVLECHSGNKNDFKKIKSGIAHVKNIFLGLQKPYTYKLESCNVHFPMTVKLEGSRVVINNFLGEKTPRFAEILPGVKVDIKGQNITVTSADKELAGQTAANLEKATKIKNRDRRVFQDGIFLTERPGDAK